MTLPILTLIDFPDRRTNSRISSDVRKVSDTCPTMRLSGLSSSAMFMGPLTMWNSLPF